MATKFTNSKNNQIEEAVQYYLENNVSDHKDSTKLVDFY